jgi:hypothetical protein
VTEMKARRDGRAPCGLWENWQFWICRRSIGAAMQAMPSTIRFDLAQHAEMLRSFRTAPKCAQRRHGAPRNVDAEATGSSSR